MTTQIERSIQARFLTFHMENPSVLTRLEALAQEWFDQGHHHVAIGMLWEVLRWQSGISTVSQDEYKLNDHYRSRYVRLILERHPEWSDAFATRRLRAA